MPEPEAAVDIDTEADWQAAAVLAEAAAASGA
jgi:hypothetical protein